MLITALHCSGVMRWNMVSRVMPALLTSTSTGPRSASTCLMPVDAGLVGRHVPLVDGDAGLGLELLRRLVVAGVVGGDLVAGGLQRLRDRRADAARSARHHRNACHDHSSLCIFSSFADARTTWPERVAPPSMRPSRSPSSRLALDAHRDAHAAADAERGEALLGVALLHLVAAASPARARRRRRSGGRCAIAPPLTLTLPVSQPRSLLTAQACAANASLASIRSRSSTFQPAFLSAAREAGIGPVPMIAGSTPACAHDTMRASGVLPRFLRLARRHQHHARRRRR